ncbi:hypothetical protein Sjap_003549 [Stephania japonica]|uniref:Uncharacterized protein n=1 Tax=Stephania japonica TaxID=461633 RepID=A0AAP0PVK3_9MAGN
MVMRPLFAQWRPSSIENTSGDHEEKGSDGLMMSSNEQEGMASSRGVVRKNAKVLQKRIAQRGLGVAQLERLRLEERWKKMTEHLQMLYHHQNLRNQHNQQFQFQFQLPFSSFLNNQIGETSHSTSATTHSIIVNANTSFVDQGRSPFFGPDSQNLSGNGGSAFVSNLNDQQRGNNPFFVENNEQTYGQPCGQTLLFHQCLSSNCVTCFEKRRSEAAMLSEHIAGFSQEKRNHAELMMAPATNQGSNRFLELALGSQTRPMMNNGNFMINKPAEFCSSFGPNKVVQNQEIHEVIGVHGKINSNDNTTNNIKKYNFFPTHHSGNNSNSRSGGSKKDYYNQFCSSTITSSVRAEATEGSPVVLSDQEPSYTATHTDTKCLDLSLKLSC